MKISEARKVWRGIGERYKSLPTPSQPSPMVEIPDNPDDLSDFELDRCLMSFGAWRATIASMLAEVSARHSLYETSYGLSLGNILADKERRSRKKLLKESLIGEAVAENKELSAFQLEVAELRAEKMLLEGKFNFINSQFETISRVITRRSWERSRSVTY